MVLALLAGGALGSAAGVALGCTFMERVLKIEPKNYLAAVDISADDNDDIPMPKTAGQPVNVLKKKLLNDTSPWLVHPDYDRVLFINTILELLWPHLSPAIHKTVIQQAKVPLADVCKKAKVLQEIRIDRLDLGTRPPRVDCFKSYETTEDELIVETPAFWGGDMRMRVTAVVKAGARTIDVPVDVANIQFKALARITVKPLVETLPCLGGVTLSLLETPHFNMDLRIGDSWDLMALPLVPTLVGTAINWVTGTMMVYPNEFAYPLLPNFGLALPPVGMLKVKVVGAKGLKGSFMDRMDAYVRLEVRKARPLKTKVIPNNENPVWNEEFDFVIDSPKEQGLSLVIKDDDLVGASTEGVAVVPLEDAEFMRRPRTTIALTVPLRAPGATGKPKKNRGNAPAADASSVAGASPRSGDTPGSSSGATPEKKKGFLSKGLAKLKPKKKPEDSPAVAAEKAMAEAVRGTLAGEGDSAAQPGQSAEASTPKGQQDGETKEATPPATPRVQLPAGALTGATLDIECTYFPFKAAQSETVSQEAAGQRATITSVRRTLLTTSTTNRNQQGVLTVTLLKCTDLADAPDSYAIIRMYDPRRLPIPNIEYRTDVVLNEDCPRYNYRCDFVNVSAAASLSVVVHEKAGTLDALKSFKLPLLQKASDKVLGRTRIAVEDVAKEGRIKDSWPLLEAQTGDIHMVLEWNPVVLDQGESPPQTQR